MTSKITLTWNNTSNIHKDQLLYKSLTSFTDTTLPVYPISLGKTVRSYIDNDVTAGLTYYYAVGTEAADGNILLSSVIYVITESASDSDPHWHKVVALLHFDGNLKDETGKVWESIGVPSITSVNPAVGSGSVEKRGGDGRLVTGHSDDFIFPADFTIEAWILTDVGANHTMLIGYVNSYNELLPLYLDSASLGRVFWKGSNVITGLTLPVGEWFHYALTRQSGVVRAFVNGVLRGENTRNGTVGLSGGVELLGASIHYTGWRGQLDDLRITKGVARYTENFTPPTEPFPNF